MVAAEPGRQFAFNRKGPGIGSYTWRYRLEPTANGTRVTESYEVERPLPGAGATWDNRPVYPALSRLVEFSFSDISGRPTTGAAGNRSVASFGIRTFLFPDTINFAGDPHVHVPKVYRELSSDRVLVVEYIDGVKMSDLEGLERAGIGGRTAT